MQEDQAAAEVAPQGDGGTVDDGATEDPGVPAGEDPADDGATEDPGDATDDDPADDGATEDPGDATDDDPADDEGAAPPDDDGTEHEEPAPAEPEGFILAPLSTGTPDTAINANNTWYAYVEDGENLDVSFVKVTEQGTGNDATIRLRGPGGHDETCTVPAGTAIGTACSFPDRTATTSGVWQIDYSDAVQNGDRFQWTIDVQDSSTTVPGRVYSEHYRISQYSGSPPVDFTLYYQSKEGYRYEAAYEEFNGINSIFTADATGVAFAGGCVSAYQSMDIGSATLEDPAAGVCGDPYKIFFEEPATDLPETATLWDGSTSTWLRPPVVQPTLGSLAFTADSPGTRSGEFTFDVTGFTGQLTVEVDGNDDGDYSDPEDASIPAAVNSDGTVAVAWDGTSRDGQPVSPYEPFGARVVIDRVGEIHFANSEVELRGGGIEVTALNGPDAGVATLYWDDTQLSAAGRCSTTPTVDGTGGVPSGGGVHGWGPGTCPSNGVGGEPWGNNRVIDDWTFHALDLSTEAVIPAETLPPFECASTAYLFQQFPTDIWEGDLVTGDFIEVATEIEDAHINGIGFNPLDGYIYGWSSSTAPGGGTYPTGLVRVGSDYNVEYLGIPTPLTVGTQIGHGDVDTDGHYWARTTDVDPNQWVEIDVEPGSPTFGEVLGSGDLVPPAGLTLNPDWSFNPADGLIYGTASEVDGTTRLISFDRTSHTISDEGVLAGVGGAFGATYMDADGYLYISDNGSGEIHRVDVANTTVSFFAQGPGGTGQNDGARCVLAPLPIDFGDAPDGYGTLLGDDGPRHAIPGHDPATNTAPLMLGSNVDIETDGFPSADADGDDLDSTPDEDGVAGPIVMLDGQPTAVSVAVTNTTGGPATLAGWIDLDDDGVFEAAEMQTAAVTASGDYVLNFDPATFVGGGTSSRFRLYPGTVDPADISPTGSAAAGEVEDYPVEGPIQAPWECASDGYLFQYPAAPPTSVISIDMVTGEDGPPLLIGGRAINAVAYNPVDNYVYGWDYNNDEFVRIGSDGSADGLGVPANWDTTDVVDGLNTAEFDTNGTFWVADGGAGTDDLLWASIDLNPGSANYFEVLTSGTAPIPGNQNMGDWAFSLSDGDLYTVNSGANPDEKWLLRFDTLTGALTAEENLGVLTAPDGAQPGVSFGAVYADADGLIYAQDNASGQIWRVDPATGQVDFFAYGPSTSLNDAARCVLAPIPVDFGDAPAGYGTTLAADGARHGIPDYDAGTNTAPLMLGSTIDIETDGFPGADADGDDLDDLADEDGVAGPIVMVDGQVTTVPVSATNNTGEDATLAGWIDLDRSGTFDAGELVTTTVGAGTQSYDLVFPAPAAYGNTHARFRLFPAGTDPADMLPTGPASAGEVEDYPVTVEPPERWECASNAPGLLFQRPAGDPPTLVQEIEMLTGADDQILDLEDYRIQAVGYNVLDDYVYGYEQLLDEIVRIGSDGLVEELGRPDTMTNPGPSGDVDDNGHYWTFDGDRWQQIDLASMTVIASGSSPTAGLSRGWDWAFVPGTDTLWRVATDASDDNILVGFDRTTKTWTTPVNLGSLSGGATVGAVYADDEGHLYISDNASGDIWRVDVGAGVAEFFADGPASAGNDGARCPEPFWIDFGDAPDAYGTTLASAGPRHGIPNYDPATNTAPLMLGSLIDPETDGFPSAGADGDDLDAVADADAVAGPIAMVDGQVTTVPVSATNDTGEDATLAGWIDLDGSGTFDAGELVTATVGAGTQSYDLAFPATATATLSDIYARFRLYPGVVDPADIVPTGAAAAGEVEDYPVSIASTEIDKEIVDVVPNGDGTSTVVYEISVTRLHADGTYELTDQLRFGAGAVILDTGVVNDMPGTISTNPSWNGDADQAVTTAPESIGAGDTHLYRAEVLVEIDEAVVTPDSSDCPVGPGEAGSGFSNSATVTVDGLEVSDEDCETFAATVVDKSITSGPTPVGAGEYEVVYEVVATNNGSAPDTYDAQDALRYGTGVNVTSATVTASPAGVTLTSGWDGESQPVLASGVAIDPAEVHTYEVTVRFAVDAEITAEAADCNVATNESGTGVMNTASVTVNGETAEVEECVEAPVSRLDKELLSVIRTGSDQYELVWTLTVDQSGGDATYELTDELQMTEAARVDAATISSTTPAGLPVNGAWDGETDTDVTTGPVAIADGGAHVYEITVQVTVDAGDVTAESSDCELLPGEGGTGSMNTATLTVNGAEIQDDDCTSFPTTPAISGGALPRTGAAVRLLAAVGLLLVLAGFVLRTARGPHQHRTWRLRHAPERRT